MAQNKHILKSINVVLGDGYFRLVPVHSCACLRFSVIKSETRQNKRTQWIDQNNDFQCKLKSKITKADIQIAGIDCNQDACYREDATSHTPEQQKQYSCITTRKTFPADARKASWYQDTFWMNYESPKEK